MSNFPVIEILKWIKRYNEAAKRQHTLFFEAWEANEHELALTELHFCLTSVCFVLRAMEKVGDMMGGEVAAYIGKENFEDYFDARNHFEHIEDRLHGSQRNRPQPISENGHTRTIHFGLDASNMTFQFGEKSIDVSDRLLSKFAEFIDELEPLVMEQDPQLKFFGSVMGQ